MCSLHVCEEIRLRQQMSSGKLTLLNEIFDSYHPELKSNDRNLRLAQDPVMKLLHAVWLTDATAWLVGDYLLMPDHVHFFCGLRDSRVTVEHWVAYWKDRFAKGHSQRTWVWQRGAFHHRVRSIQEYREKWTYMMENPVRKGLVTQWEDWPWRGRVHDFSW